MSGAEEPPKITPPAEEPLTPEQKRASADRAVVAMTKFVDGALALDRSDIPDPAVKGRDAHRGRTEAATEPDSAVVKPPRVSRQEGVLTPRPRKIVRGAGAALADSTTPAQTKTVDTPPVAMSSADAALPATTVDTPPAASVDTVPDPAALEAAATRKIRENQIKSLIDEYGEDPQLLDLLNKLDEPDIDQVITAAEQKFHATDTPADLGVPLGQVAPIQRVIGTSAEAVDPIKAEKRTKESLLSQVADGAEIVIRSSKGGQTVTYRRDGGWFVHKSSGRENEVDLTNIILDRLNLRSWTIVGEAAKAGTPADFGDTVPGELLPDTTGEKTPDRFLPLEEAAEASYVGKNGQRTVVRSGDKYYLARPDRPDDTLSPSFSQSEIQTLATEEAWFPLDKVPGLPDVPDKELLAPGETKYFLVPALGTAVMLMRNGDNYMFSDGQSGPTTVLGEKEMRELVEAAHWEEISAAQVSEMLANKPLDIDLRKLGLDVNLNALEKASLKEMLVVGGVWESGMGMENKLGKKRITIQEISGETVTILYEIEREGEATREYPQTLSREELAGTLKDEVYTRVEGVPGKEKKEEPKPEAPEMSKIEELRILVDEFRMEYVRTDYNQDTAFKKLKLFFNLGGNRGDVDTKDVEERYRLALTNLKEAELEQLKNSGLTGEALKKEMARLLSAFTLGERVNLKLDRIKAESEYSKFKGVITGIENIGKWYNGLSPKTKLIVGALGLAGGGVAFATGGTAVGASAAGLLLLKRLVTTAGAKVAADGLLEQAEDWATKYFSEKEQAKDLEELEKLNTPLVETDPQGISLEALEKLSERAQASIDSSDKKLQNQKRNQLWRKTATLGVAIAASSYFTYRAGVNIFGGGSGGGTPTMDERKAKFNRDHGLAPASPASAASAAETGASRPAAAALPGQAVSAPAGAATEAMHGANMKPVEPFFHPDAPTGAGGAKAGMEALSSRESLLLQKYDVVAADGKRGLWGIIDRRLPGDISPSDKNRVIASLENILRGMTPEQLKAAGFRTGDINKIYPGDKIDFGKLLTPQQIQSVLDGKSVGAPSVAAVTPGAETIAKAVTQVVDTKSPGYAASIEAAQTEMINQDRAAHGLLSQDQISLKAAEDEMIAQDKAAHPPVSGKSPIVTRESISNVPVQERLPANVVTLSDLNDPRALAEFAALHEAGMRRTFIDINRSIFQMPESRTGVSHYAYNHLTKGTVSMSWVGQTLEGMHRGVVRLPERFSVRFPLHPSQMENIMRLTEIAQDRRMFGLNGIPLPNETVDGYTSRMAAYAVATGKEERLARALYRGIY